MTMWRPRGVGLWMPLALFVLATACATDPTPRPTPADPTAPPTLSPTPTAEAPEPEPQTYHVARDGDDAGPGTEDEPFASVTAGLMALAPGDTLLIRGGTYDERVVEPPIRPGTPDAPITVAAYPGERPVIRGLFWLVGPDYWTIEGLEVTWHSANQPTDHLVKITDGVGWTVRDSEFWGAESFAAMLVAGTRPGQPDAWRITGSCIHSTRATNATNQDHNLYVNTGLEAGEGIIEGNIFFDAANGQNIKLGGPRSAPDDGAANVTIRYNTMDHAAQSMLLAGGTTNVTIERNIVGGSFAPWLVRGFQLTGEANVVRDNVGYGADQWINVDDGFGGLRDGGRNRFVDPAYDDVGCDGFRPTNRLLNGHGRWAFDGGGD
jgi:hypothetical protein